MISVLCPTRGRPANVDRMAASVFDTAAKPHAVEVVLYADDDDPTLDELHDVVYHWTTERGHRVRLVVGPRVVLSECWNRCAEVARYDVMAHSDDDVVYRTDGWDRLVLDVFDGYPDRIVFVYGRDGIHDASFGTHGFVHRRWVDTVGYLAPPYFSSDYNDTWLNEVASALGRRVYLPGLYTEHMHPVVGKAPWDATYHERMERHTRDGVDALYAAKRDERLADVDKLRAVLT